MKRTLLLIFLGALLVWGGLVVASSPSRTPEARRTLTEAEAKAAFLLNFARFTEWPKGQLPRTSQPIIIGVTSENPVADELQRLSKGFLIQGHTAVIVVLEGPFDDTKCQVLFIGDVGREKFTRYLEQRAGLPILVVGDQPESAKWGALVAFQPASAKLQFIINRKAARARNIVFSSQLLKLAARILD